MILLPNNLEKILQETGKEIQILTFNDELLNYSVNFRNREKSNTFSISSTLSLTEKNKYQAPFIKLEKEFTKSKHIIYSQITSKLKELGIQTNFDDEKLTLFNDAKIYSSGSIFSYFGNEFNISIDFNENITLNKLLLSEIAYATISSKVIYDQVNLVMFNRKTSSKNKITKKIKNQLIKDQNILEKFRNTKLTTQVQNTYNQIFLYIEKIDQTIHGKENIYTLN